MLGANALGFMRDYYGFLSPSTDYFLSFLGLHDGSFSDPGLATRSIIENYQNDVFSGSPFTHAEAAYSSKDKDVGNAFVGSMLVRSAPVATTPIPAALPLFASALGGLGFFGWRRRTARQPETQNAGPFREPAAVREDGEADRLVGGQQPIGHVSHHGLSLAAIE